MPVSPLPHFLSPAPEPLPPCLWETSGYCPRPAPHGFCRPLATWGCVDSPGRQDVLVEAPGSTL